MSPPTAVPQIGNRTDEMLPPGRGIEDDIAFERLSSLHANAVAPVLAGLAFALVVAHLVAPYFGPWQAWGWCGSKMAIGLWRLHISLRFPADQQRRQRMRRWFLVFIAALLVDAVSWGAMGALFSQSGNTMIDGLILAGTVGVAAVSLFPLLSYHQLAIAFLGIELTPTATMYALSDQYGAWHVVAGLVVYFLVLISEVMRSEKRVLELLRLRFENSAIAAQQQEALALARHASAAKSRFLATVSHELRTPLNGILGTVALMRMDTLSPPQGERLTVVKHSADHLLNVLGDLLDFSRIEHGRITIQPSPTDLRTMVTDVTELLGALATDRGLRFELTLAPEVPSHVLCDAARVKQVLHNLLGNALKFTPRGGEVRLAVRQSPQADGETTPLLQFEVTDTGPGIPPEDQERIFHAFEQGQGAGPQGRIGTGLGLTISRELARVMGGTVQCTRASSGGACFTLELPCPLAAPASEERRPALAVLTPLAGRVLLVEDHEVNAVVARALLERLGLSVSTTGNGQEALDWLAQHPTDLVLMDCQMPVLDGWETTRRWRAREAQGRRLPIIALTANAVQGDREACLAAGMDDYLPKPFTPESLHAALSRWLPRS